MSTLFFHYAQKHFLRPVSNMIKGPMAHLILIIYYVAIVPLGHTLSGVSSLISNLYI